MTVFESNVVYAPTCPEPESDSVRAQLLLPLLQQEQAARRDAEMEISRLQVRTFLYEWIYATA